MKDDGSGPQGRVKRIELMTSMDWDAALSRIKDQETIICTYGDPDTNYNPYLKKHLPHMSNVTIVNGFDKNKANEKDYVEKISSFNKNAKIYVKENTHAKALLIAPDEVYLTSQNVGDSEWFQVTVHITDAEVYTFYKNFVSSYMDADGNISTLSRDYDRLPCLAPEKQDRSQSLKNIAPCSPRELKSVECKFFKQYNWNQKFNNIKNRHFIIVTYSLPDLNYTVMTMNKLLAYGNSVTLIVNSAHENVARSVEQHVNNRNFKYYLREDLHAKMVLCSNGSVWLGSHNFGDSSWFETLMQIKKNSCVYEFYLSELEKYMTKDGFEFIIKKQ